MVKLTDIARVAGVSTAKVSRALAASSQVSKVEAERIRGIATEMGWSGGNRLAMGMRSGRSGIIGCLVYDMKNPYYSELMAGIEQEALERDHIVLFCDVSRPSALMGRLIEYQVDGLILTCDVAADAGRVAAFMACGHPVVTTADSALPYVPTCRVTADYRAASFGLTAHLVALGHRSIVYCGDATPDGSRLSGFTEAMRASGLAPGPDMSALAAHGPSVAGGRATAKAIMALPDLPTAAVVHNDLRAVGVVLELRERGLAVPEQVSVCSFDGLEPCQWMTPPLASVATSNELWGRLAARAVLTALAGPPGEPVSDVEVPWRLSLRGTVAPPRQRAVHRPCPTVPQ